jgi:RNA polymerase sigma-70 factor, ECF subfamily
MPAGEEFAEALRAAQLGQESGFTSLYRAFNARVVRYFSSRVPVPGLAEDLAADTWIGAARNLRAFEGDEQAFRAWLFTIANRRLVQHWREASRRPSVEPLGEAHTERAGSQEVEASAIQAVLAQQAARRIAAVLTADQAEVVLLRVLAGLSVEEVARILGKRSGAVRALQHKAVVKLAGTDFFLQAVTK